MLPETRGVRHRGPCFRWQLSLVSRAICLCALGGAVGDCAVHGVRCCGAPRACVVRCSALTQRAAVRPGGLAAPVTGLRVTETYPSILRLRIPALPAHSLCAVQL